MNLQQRKLFFLFAILGIACIVVEGRQIAAKAMILEKRQVESAPDQVTEVSTVIDIVSSAGTKAPPVTVTRVSTSQRVISRTSSITPTSSVSSSPSPTTSSALYCNVGYTLCGAELGGGCCKTGYTCALTGCVPPAGTTTPPPSRTCAVASQTVCASSMNYGCCVVGQECGFSSCTPVGGLAVTKAPDVDANNIKLSATATTPAPSPTSTPQESKSDDAPLSKIAIGGIVGGSVVAIIALALAWIFTRKHIRNRSNVGVSGGVGTTNFFDPTATLSGQHGSHSSRYRGGSHPPTAAPATTKISGGPKMSEYQPHRPVEGLATLPQAHSPPVQHSPPAGDQRFSFGVHGVGGAGGHGYQPVPVSDQMLPAELGTSPVEGWGVRELQGEGNEVFEIEGDEGGRSPEGKRKSWGWGRGANTR